MSGELQAVYPVDTQTAWAAVLHDAKEETNTENTQRPVHKIIHNKAISKGSKEKKKYALNPS